MGDRSLRVTLTDDRNSPRASLNEGDEVTVVAWRPGWEGTTRYCVRVTHSGLEGWLPAANLRNTKTALPSAPPAPPPPAGPPPVLGARASEAAGRRFGQRV